ncbi:MAG: nucleotidyl transferase AbiEii/AbiGii toxin family protein, partial [Pseudomonadota bacterium]
RPFIGVPCHRRAADCCGENSTSKEEWNKELGTRHREQHNQRLLFTPLRTPLWSAATKDSSPVGGETATQVLVLDKHELAAGKLAALVARCASRDVFDARELLRRPDLDRAKLRLGFVVYGGMNRKDWRTITIEQIQTTAADVDSQLVPVLRADVRPTKAEIVEWTDSLVREARALMAVVLPFTKTELEFLRQLNETGDITPELLTGDTAMQAIIREHPGLKWKAQNVKKRLGGTTGDAKPTG